MYFLSIFLKSLAGYEYLSSVVIFSLAIFLVDPFLPNPRYGFTGSIRILFVLSLLSVAGFIFALLMHASIRADSIIQGIKITLEGDAIKYNNLSQMTGSVSRGIQMPFSELLGQYIFDWTTPVIFWVQSKLIFPALIFLALLSILFQFVTNNIERHRDAAIVFVMMLAPLSWYVLMKGHSVIHTHMNYVLWYFGFIPAIIFVGLRGVILCWHFMKVNFSVSKYMGRSNR
jgi:hypothetical protein